MSISEAIFAAGCFWSVQAAFDKVPGVMQTEAGYIGGNVENPTYQEVCTGETNHAEAVKVTFDSDVISYKNLVNIFFNIHNPTTLNRQGPDIGTQYRSAIFYKDESQKNTAAAIIDELNRSGLLKNKIVTQLIPATTFYPAEDYHQKYLQKRGESRCSARLQNIIDLDDKQWREILSDDEYDILRGKKTERPFTGEYLHQNKDGVYVCAACHNPIFASDSQFDSGSGWPSFDRAIPFSVRNIDDYSHNMHRTEVVCARCGSHLGHVFTDGPTTTGMRYCINSGAMDFEQE